MNGLNTARHMDAFYRVENTSNGLDMRIPKQRATNTENDSPGRISSRYMVDAKSASYRKPSPTMRQPSGSRDYKAPSGPRPPEFVSKRLTSGGYSEIPPPPKTARLSYAHPTSEPFPGLAARRLISTSGTTQFLDHHDSRHQSSESGQSSPQQLFFDALQDRPLTVESFHDKSFLPMNSLPGLPASNTGVQSRLARDGIPNLGSGQRSSRGSPALVPKGPGVSASAALRAAQLSATSAFGAPVIVPLVSVKRASNSALTNNTHGISQRPREESPLRAQIPRKAVASKPSIPQASNRESEMARGDRTARAEESGKSRLNLISNSNTNLTGDKYMDTSSRARKPVAPLTQPSKSQLQVHLNGSSMNIGAGEEFMPDYASPPLRPVSPSFASTHRQSSASFHTGGLGARTISPTDARRLKRLSSHNLDQAASVRRRSPTPELTFGRRPEKSPQRLTVPTSPPLSSSHHSNSDGNQRPNFGRTISSQSSFSSLRPPSASFQLNHGTGQTTAKPRLSYSPVSTAGEMVPPVPAIPKAYDTPSEIDQPFFSHLKLESPELKKPNDKSQGTTRRPLLETPDLKATIVTSSESRQRRGQTMSQPGSEPNTSSQMRSKNMAQTSRLPPLKLAPLSVPAAAQIDAYVEPQARPTGMRTPSTHRLNTITPSTPLTASKAVFSTRDLQFNSDQDITLKRRSKTSSQYDLASIFKSAKSSPAKAVGLHDSHRHSILPPPSKPVRQYSTNLPGLEDDNVSQNASAANTEPHISKLATLRNRALSKSHDVVLKSVQPLGSADPQSPASSSGLRRRLSLGWRRSSSKTAFHPQAPEQVQYMQPATMEEQLSPPLGLDGSTAGRTPPITKAAPSPRLPSVASGNGTPVETNTRLPAPAATRPTPTPLRSSSSLLLSTTRPQPVPASKPEGQRTQRHDPVADDEMKRLAAKRKDFESAVKDLDIQSRRAIAREPILPGLACRKVRLTIYERGEIIDYNHIYFCGNDNAEKLQADLGNQTTNFGFDDDRGDYNIVYGDHLAYRYEVLDPLGKGSFGQVVRCIDYKTGKLVAIKIIRNKKRFHQQALVEVNILKKLREWDPEEKHSMVKFTQSFYFRGHLCISTELLGMNLYEFIKAYDFKGFSLILIRRFAQQMLSSLTLLHSRNVIHCDLKPENVLLSHPYRSEIKVIDFGSSCLENEKVYTYIQSRFYRSPEVILGMDYGMPIDMWSLGCILAELLIGYPIFPGENEQEQLACIMEVFGPPEKHLIELSTRKKLFFDSVGKPRITVSTKGKRRRPSSKTLQQALKCDDEAFVDFISRCLRWDPKRRMKPTEGLNHDFITGQRKTTTRSRVQANPSSGRLSPTKRFNTGQTPARAKPVTEAVVIAPGPILPSSLLGGSKQNLSTGRDDPLPAKVTATPRRISTMHGTQAMATKRSSTGAAMGSALPRVVPRNNMPGRTDLASAAAASAAQRTR